MKENYLYHYGIIGQKWGVRRYENYDGTLTKAGKDRYGRSDSDRRKLASQMKKDIATEKGLKWQERNTKSPFAEASKDNWSRNIKRGTVYEEIHSSLKDAKDKFEKANKVISDYWNNDELVNKYRKKAARLSWEEYGDGTEESLKGFEYGYLEEDADQGSGNSFELYCKDKGLNYSEIDKTRYESFKEYENACAKAVSEILGEYGDEVLEKGKALKYGNFEHTIPEKTIASEVGKIIADIDDDDFYRKGIFNLY